jgi:hypothetical protein
VRPTHLAACALKSQVVDKPRIADKDGERCERCVFDGGEVFKGKGIDDLNVIDARERFCGC